MSGVTCLIAERTGEGREKVKKTLESYLYKLQGQGFLSLLAEEFALKIFFPLASILLQSAKKCLGTSGN